MPNTNSPVSVPGSSALTAFLHGIEPRAWVFALSQCGDPDLADLALESSMEDFTAKARSLPLAEWPMQFWASLVKQPLMLSELDLELDLAQLTPGPRAALLLRLIASLDVSHAAQVLGVSPAAYEAVLAQALSNPALRGEWMQDLREQLHELIHQMPAERREALATIRTRVLATVTSQATEEAAGLAHGPHWARWLWLAVVVLLLVLAASFLRPIRALIAPGHSESLPSESVPPPPALTDSIVLTHPDYAQVAEPGDEQLATRLAFLSWMAGSAAPTAAAVQPVTDPIAPENFAALPDSQRQLLSSAGTAWSGLDAESRAALIDNAQDWQTRSASQRAELRERLQAWDRQAAPARARRRSPFVAWQALNAADRRRLRVVAAQLTGLPAPDQQALLAQFAALPADIQRLWWLGPSLGRELAPIASLFAFVPEAQRLELLEVLRRLDPQSRADLAVLAPRLDEAQRQSLRRTLLQAPAAQRAALIRQHLAQ